MTIPIQYESDELIAEFPRLLEVCHFCKVPTRYWHENTNNPVCELCAKSHKVAELPDWGKAIRAYKRKQKRQSQMSNETEREAFEAWHANKYKLSHDMNPEHHASRFIGFQAGAAYQRQQDKGLVEALEWLIAIAEGRETNNAWMTVDRAREALSSYRAAQEGK